MEDNNQASSSDTKKKQQSNDGTPTQAEKDKKCLRDIAVLIIRTARLSPASFMERLYKYLPFNVSQLEREVLKIHKELKEKAKKFLKVFDGKLTLSFDRLFYDAYDNWDSYTKDGPVLHRDFVCMSVHFVDHKWKVRKWFLGYYPLEYSEKVGLYRVKTLLWDYGIENKVSTFLVPNGGDETLDDGFRKWIEKKGNKPIDPRLFRVYCCSDLFRLMASDVFGNMDMLLEEIRVMVGWGKFTSTNWNVTLGSLQDTLDMKDKRVFEEDDYYQDFDQPSNKEWRMVRTFCKLIGCVYKVAKELFEGEYSTSNVYFHLLAELKVMLNQELASSDKRSFIREAKKILKRFDEYWDKMFLVLAIASVLDPRFKMKYLEFYCLKNDDEGSKAETVLGYLRNLYAQYVASDIHPETESADATFDSLSHTSYEDDEEKDSDFDDEESDFEEEEEEKPDPYNGFAFFQEYLKFEGSSIEYQDSELDSYLKEPVMEWNRDFKALEWWKEESQKYPTLSRLASDILSIPISRATSYEAYVAERRECPEFVVSMKARLGNAIMCSRRWSRL